jgi:hypothetical protein
MQMLDALFLISRLAPHVVTIDYFRLLTFDQDAGC